MVKTDASFEGHRLGSEVGIAIGPILFVIAVLGILASAIAAGSGSFTAGSATEGNRAKASAMIEIGQNLKIGFDRVLGAGIDFENVVIDEDNTSDDTDLFSPTGGGITFPSTTLANATTDVWHYPLGHFPKMGASATTNYDKLAVLRVSSGVCAEINLRADAISTVSSYTSTTVAAADLEVNTNAAEATIADWPTALQGHPTGCIIGTDGHAYFYQVIGIR